MLKFSPKTLSEIRKRRSPKTTLHAHGSKPNSVLLLPSTRGTSWEVTMHAGGVIEGRRVDTQKWLGGETVVSDGLRFNKQVPSTSNPKSVARSIDAMLREKSVEVNLP